MKPIFIGGCDRSGTTMLAANLAKMPNVVAIPESQFFYELIHGINNGYFADAQSMFDFIDNDFRFHAWGLSAQSKSEIIAQDLNPTSAEKTIVALVRRYLNDKNINADGVEYFVEHSPDNVFNYSLYRGVFSDASLLHIVRDPRGVYASFKGLSWGPATPLHCAKFWAEKVKMGLALESGYGNSVKRVKYEDLVSSANALTELLAFLGLDSTLLSTQSSLQLPEFTRAQHSMVGSAMDASKASDWQLKLSTKEQYSVANFDESWFLLGLLGYPSPEPRQPVPMSALALDHLLNFFTSSLRYLKFKRVERNIVRGSE